MDGSSDSLIAQLMVGAIVFPFVLVVFLLLLNLYAKLYWWRIEQPPDPLASRRQRRRLVFASGQDPAFTLRTGLDAAVLRSIPAVTFSPQNFKDGLECAVCLSELVEGEKARLLPKCNHGFHVECIDMWFQSHSTCPLCRNPVDLQCSNSMEIAAEVIDSQCPQENSVSGSSMESPNFPTNVLFWGNESQVSTGSAASSEEGSSSATSSSTLSTSRRGEMLVIDIPMTMSEHLLSSPPIGSPQEELKSPMTTRLRSLKRLLSREKGATPSSSNTVSSISCDIEQVRKG